MNKDIEKYMKEHMSSLEIVTTKKTSGFQDNSAGVRRSTLDLPDVQKKFSAVVGVAPSANISADASSKSTIHMAVVRPKGSSQDGIVSKKDERTVIFKDGKLYGSQG